MPKFCSSTYGDRRRLQQGGASTKVDPAGRQFVGLLEAQMNSSGQRLIATLSPVNMSFVVTSARQGGKGLAVQSLLT